MKHLSPAHLEVLLHCYAIPQPHPKAGEPWMKELMAEWVRDGIVEPGKVEGSHYTTDKGAAWVRLILQTPQPRQAWIDPRKQEGQ